MFLTKKANIHNLHRLSYFDQTKHVQQTMVGGRVSTLNATHWCSQPVTTRNWVHWRVRPLRLTCALRKFTIIICAIYSVPTNYQNISYPHCVNSTMTTCFGMPWDDTIIICTVFVYMHILWMWSWLWWFFLSHCLYGLMCYTCKI